MLDDVHQAIKTDNFDNLADLSKRDETIDRYYFFIVRQIRTIFERPQISKPLNYSHKKMIDLRLLAKIIEDVGDSLKTIAEILPKLDNFIRDQRVHQFLLDYFEILEEAFKKLADILRVSVSEQRSSVGGPNPKIMRMIYKYRTLGRSLDKRWQALIPKIEIDRKGEKYNFQEYYNGAKLLDELEDIFKKIFDFTNIFF
ncbi:MAG: phosphate uptake regulator PhoU, partial [Candidatus Heimdallarchaeota archaeon]|nr:phosphate uptake regulator PhoU [Candidatus Heimdallarchaeota archaeon]